MAKLAKKTGRYIDMKNFMNELVVFAFSSPDLDVELTGEERDLLSLAYKKCMGELRDSWKSLQKFKQKRQQNLKDKYLSVEEKYRLNLEAQIEDLHKEFIGLLEKCVISSAKSIESKVFCLQMKGDFHGYLAEIKIDDERKKLIHDALEAYNRAKSLAKSYLRPCDPGRLSLELSLGLFKYDILNAKKEVVELNYLVLHEAKEDLKNMDKESTQYKKAEIVLNSLKDNLNNWILHM